MNREDQVPLTCSMEHCVVPKVGLMYLIDLAVQSRKREMEEERLDTPTSTYPTAAAPPTIAALPSLSLPSAMCP